MNSINQKFYIEGYNNIFNINYNKFKNYISEINLEVKLSKPLLIFICASDENLRKIILNNLKIDNCDIISEYNQNEVFDIEILNKLKTKNIVLTDIEKHLKKFAKNNSNINFYDAYKYFLESIHFNIRDRIHDRYGHFLICILNEYGFDYLMSVSSLYSQSSLHDFDNLLYDNKTNESYLDIKYKKLIL